MRGNLQEIFELDCSYAEMILLKYGEAPAMWLLHNDDATSITLIKDKRNARNLIRLKAIATGAYAMTTLMEVWSQKGDEAVLVVTRYREADGVIKTLSSVRTIIRDADGKAVGLGPSTVVEDVRASGIDVDILPASYPTPEARDLAQVLLNSTDEEGEGGIIK